MNNKDIGEYLKRLRLRAGYTQSDLGSYIHVTDKAISRWESGVGMPEIGNLLVLSKLFGVTVDDILNCNEKIFENSTEHEQPATDNAETTKIEKPEDTTEATVSPASADTANTETPVKRKNVFSDPAAKFLTVIFFAYFAIGIFSVTFIPSDVSIDLSAIYIIFTVLTVLTAIAEFISFKLPVKIYKIVIIALYSLLIINCLILMIFQFVYDAYGYERTELKKTAAFLSAVFVLLFVMQLLYKFYEFTSNEKLRKIFNFTSFGVSALALVMSLLSLILNGADPFYYFAKIGIIFVGLSAFLFAIGQLTTKSVNIGTPIIMIVAAIVAGVTAVSCSTGLTALETMFTRMQLGFSLEFLYLFAMLAPIVTAVSRLFEKHKFELLAKRICSALSVILPIPFIAYTIDITSVNNLLGYTVHTAALIMRIILLFIAIAGYLKSFISSFCSAEK